MLTIGKLAVISALLVAGCQTAEMYQPKRSTPKLYYSNLSKADVSEFRVVMSMEDAERVIRRDGWKLDNPYTAIEDIKIEYANATGLMKGLDRTVYYTRVEEKKKKRIELTFCANRLMWVRERYAIKEEEFEDTVEKARFEVGKLGAIKTDGWTDKLRYIISYNPHKRGYMYFSIHKLVEGQRGYRVWATLHDRSHCR